MASSFGGTISLKGESEYRKALNEITSNLKVLSSEMKVVTSQYDRNDKSASNLSQQNTVLTKKIEEQKSKVDILTQALEDSKKETGDNSTTTKKWQTELNNAQAELNKLEKGLKDNTTEIKNFGDATDDASEGTSRLSDIIKGNLISQGIISGIKSLGGAMKSVASSLIDVGKQAINSYADYEQLVGGVSTLLGTNEMSIEEYAESVGKSVDEIKEKYSQLEESQQMTLDYANNAYKTAGLSANEYMETVTSFSASLLQSLDGDTVEASKKANQAIIDMSDNANKMGTDMTMIQNAYQGFAKQNYTMLDNLKLGYGGTKTEMERLLADAEKISGTKYDISNLSDVYDAIHIIQTEIGITGTTSREASKTIQGSVNSMKSAWNNLLTGIADENADWGTLVNNFVDSVVTAGNNLLPRIEVAVEGVGLLITDALGLLLYNVVPMAMQFIQNLITGISSQLPDIIASVNNAISVIINGIVSMLPQILEMGIQIIVSLIQGISQSLPNLIPQMIDAVITMVNTLLDNIDMIINTGIELLVALTDGIMNALPDLIARLPEIIIKITSKLLELTPQLISCAIRLMVSLALGLIRGIPELISKIPQIIKSIINAFTQHAKDIANIGKNLVSGIWEGISSSLDWIKSKLKGWIGNVTKFIKKIFGINSPSKLFKDEIGTNLALGIGEGFGDTMKDVSKSMASSIPTEFDTNINANYGSNNEIYSNNYEIYLRAFKDALKDTKVVMNGREMGNFVIDTMEGVVYS